MGTLDEAENGPVDDSPQEARGHTLTKALGIH